MTEVMICSLGFDGQLCMEHQLQNWSANDGGMYQENTAFCINSKCTRIDVQTRMYIVGIYAVLDNELSEFEIFPYFLAT